MTLEFIDHRPEAVESWWTPFTSSDGYEHPHWWQSAGGTIGDPWIVQVLEAGVEVARVQLDEIGGINPHYSNVPAIGDEQLEIQFIEVATAARRRKIGTQVVQALSVRSPDRRLLAYSKVRTNSGHRSVGTGSITRTGVTAPCSSSRSGICPKYALLATNARHEGALQVTGFIRGPQLADLLTQSARAAFNELERLDADHLLSENVDVLVHGLLARHMPEPVSVDWTAARGTPVQETTIERTTMEFGERRDYRIPGSRLTVSWPLTGTAEILRRQASQFTWGADHGTIMDHSVQLNIEGTELSTEFIEQQMAAVHEDVEKRIGWANHDVTVHRTAVERELRQAIEARRARISENRRISTALNIPIMPTGAQRPPVPARRRQVPLQQRRGSVEFTPEPVLEEAIYRDILGVVENWARSLERTCTPPIRALGEEALRDLLLGTLNGYWQGGAGGELFNGHGKTDILIREGGRNAFVAECKVWSGASRATAALDQLLSYLVWRDTKAALIVFIKRAKPTEVISRLHAAVREHPRHLLTTEESDPTRRADYVFTAEDGERRIELAVIPGDEAGTD